MTKYCLDNSYIIIAIVIKPWYLFMFLQILRLSHTNNFLAFGTLYLYTLCILIITSYTFTK